jgi:hypothetical protein
MELNITVVVFGSSEIKGRNVMADPVSISIKHISATAKSSVAKALEQHRAAFPGPHYIFGFVPPWWLGIVIRNPEGKITFADAQKLATDLQHSVAATSPALRGGKPGVVFGDGNLTIGFAPPEITVIEE